MRNIIKNVTSGLLFILFILSFATQVSAEVQSDDYNLGRSLVPYATVTAPPNSVPITNIFQVPTGANSSIAADNRQVIVTPNLNNQKGAVFSTSTNMLDFSKDFSSKMYVNLGNEGTNAADGMSFVMHNDPSVLSNFTMSPGGQLGVWGLSGASNLRTQIKKSLAIEFDTYYNGDGMDNNVGSNQYQGHVAYAYPDQLASYSNISQAAATTAAVLKHQGLQFATKPLSDGTWHPFEITWNATTKIFSYKFDYMAKVSFPLDPIATFGSTNTYWGFTGSTGGQKELNSVVFAEVPGLVNFSENITSSSGDSINWGSRSTVELDYNYLNGKQNLISPKLALTLDEYITYVPNTLKINDVVVNDSNWIDAKNLSLAFADLSLSNPTAKITFDVQASNVSLDTLSTISYSLVTSNYIGTSKTKSLGIKSPKLQINQTSNMVTLSLEELAYYKTLTAEEINANIQEKLGIKAIDTVTNSSTGIGYVDYRSDGVSRISSWIQSNEAKPGATIGYKYKAGYYGTTVNSTDVFITGILNIQAIDLDITQSSSELSLTAGDIEKYALFTNAQVEEDVKIKLGISATDKISGNSEGISYNGFIKGSNDELLGEAVKKAVPGVAINYYYVAQKEGISSNSVEGFIRVNEGLLGIESFSSQSTFEISELSNESTFVSRDNSTWGLTINDSRATGSTWNLSATASKMIDNDGKILKGSLIFVDGSGQQSILNPIESTVLSSGLKTTESTNIISQWTESSGILLKVDSGNLKGNYSGSIEWILSDVP